MSKLRDTVYVILDDEGNAAEKYVGGQVYASRGAAINRCRNDYQVHEFKLVPTGRVFDKDGKEVPTNDSTIQE